MNTDELQQRIQRVLLDEKTRERLLGELQSASQEQLKAMKNFLDTYESETLNTLNEKAEAIEEQLEQARSFLPERKEDTVSKETALKILSDLEEIFLNKEKLAKFLTFSDDRVLYNLEKMFQGDLKEFFKEIRLQKEAFQKAKSDDMKKHLSEEILSSQSRQEKLNDFLNEAKKIIRKK